MSEKDVTSELGPQGRAFQVKEQHGQRSGRGAGRALGMGSDTQCAGPGAPSEAPGLPQAERGLEVTEMGRVALSMWDWDVPEKGQQCVPKGNACIRG